MSLATLWRNFMAGTFHKHAHADPMLNEIERLDREITLEGMAARTARLATEVAKVDPQFRPYAQRAAEELEERESRVRMLEQQKDLLTRRPGRIEAR